MLLSLERNVDLMRIPPADIQDPKLALAVINAQRQIAASALSAQVRVDEGTLRRPADDKLQALLSELKGEEPTPAPQPKLQPVAAPPEEDPDAAAIAAMLADLEG